jgi:flagellar biosynthesis repressor protein FlbT
MIHIKPGESLFIGKGSITNRSDFRAHLELNGEFPWLHEKEVMQEAEATSPCKRLYLAIQRMYLHGQQPHETYLAQQRDIEQAAPSTAPYLKKISDEIQAGRFHKAMKEAERLIEYEANSLSRATVG